MLDNDAFGTGLVWGSNKVPAPVGIRHSKEIRGSTVLWSRRVAPAVRWWMRSVLGFKQFDDAHGRAAVGTHEPVGW